ncbi:MAG: hypothetical protein HY861_01575 [Chlamydiia bacterium]|nr:hypothetical protein [Chlamydiia bacterium]
MRLLYNVALLLYLIFSLPRLIKKSVRDRFFPSIPDPQGKEVIWIHAVSVGEIKSAKNLFATLRYQKQAAFFLITTTTATGQAEARRSLPGAHAYRHLPFDISWNIHRWVNRLRPSLFILIESDFWPNLLSSIKKQGGRTALVSGKISERSAKRFSWIRPTAKLLFDSLDLLIVQNEEHQKRFLPLCTPSRLHIGGNLKLDLRPEPVDRAYWQNILCPANPIITLSCTHAPEEERLLELLPLSTIFLILAPRHPQRFEEVASILKKKQIPFFRWSRLQDFSQEKQVLLIDAMGKLPICYSLSRLAIVAGSFTHTVGGHNCLEPCLYGIPVLFGPHTFGQREIVSRILETNSGRETSYASVKSDIERFLNTPLEEEAMKKGAYALTEPGQGSTEKTLALLFGIQMTHIPCSHVFF